MENRNIYKMDDILIVLSFIMLIPAGIIAWPWLRIFSVDQDFMVYLQKAPLLLGARFEMVLFYLAGAIFSQFLGRVVRHKEKQSLLIVDYLIYSRETSIKKISMAINLPEGRIVKLVKSLSRIPRLGISLSGSKVTMTTPGSAAASSVDNSSVNASDYSSTRETSQSTHSSDETFMTGEVQEEQSFHSSSTTSSRFSGSTGQPMGLKEMYEGLRDGNLQWRDSSGKEVPPEVQQILSDSSLGMFDKLKKLQALNMQGGGQTGFTSSTRIVSENGKVTSYETSTEPMDSTRMNQAMESLREAGVDPNTIPGMNSSFSRSSSSSFSSSSSGTSGSDGKQLSPLVFVILMITPLWPVGIFLFIRYIIKQKKALESQGGSSE